MSRIAVAAACLALLVLSVLPVGRALVSAVLVDDSPGRPWEFTTAHLEEALDPYGGTRTGATPGPSTAPSGAPGAPSATPGVPTAPSAQAGGAGAAPVRAPWARLRLLGNSVLIGLASALFAVLLGVPYALLVSRTDVFGRRFFAGAYLVPLVLPPLLVAVAWNYVPFLAPPPITSVTEPSHWGGVVAVLRAAGLFALCYFPIVVLFARRAFQRVPASQEEAARLVVGPWATLRRVTLPLAAPGIAAGAVFVFLFALNDFAVVDFLNWVRPTSDRISVYPYEAFVAWSKSQGPGVAAALGLPLAALGSALLAVLHHLFGRRPTGVVSTTYREAPPVPLGALRVPLAVPLAALLALTVGGPLAALVWKSAHVAAYQRVWALVEGPASSTNEVRWALWFAALAAALALPLAFVLGHRAARTGRLRLLALAFLPLALPPVFLGAGYLRLLNSPLIQDVFGNNPFLDQDSPQYGPALLMLAKYLPFALAALWAAFLEVDPRLEEAARSAGANALARALGVLEPLVRPALLLAFTLVFVLALREIDTVVLLTGNTVMRKIYTMIHFQRDEQVAALCVVLILMQAVPLAVYAILRGGRDDAVTTARAPRAASAR